MFCFCLDAEKMLLGMYVYIKRSDFGECPDGVLLLREQNAEEGEKRIRDFVALEEKNA